MKRMTFFAMMLFVMDTVSAATAQDRTLFSFDTPDTCVSLGYPTHRLREQQQRQSVDVSHIAGDGPLTPWDDFNSRGDWYELLQRQNWTSSDGIHWRQPEAKSNNGHSATLRQAQSGDFVLHVFTTSANVFWCSVKSDQDNPVG